MYKMPRATPKAEEEVEPFDYGDEEMVRADLEQAGVTPAPDLSKVLAAHRANRAGPGSVTQTSALNWSDFTEEADEADEDQWFTQEMWNTSDHSLRNFAGAILVFLLVATAVGVGLKTQYGGGGGGSSAKKKRSKRRRVRRT